MTDQENKKVLVSWKLCKLIGKLLDLMFDKNNKIDQ